MKRKRKIDCAAIKRKRGAVPNRLDGSLVKNGCPGGAGDPHVFDPAIGLNEKLNPHFSFNMLCTRLGRISLGLLNPPADLGENRVSGAACT